MYSRPSFARHAWLLRKQTRPSSSRSSSSPLLACVQSGLLAQESDDHYRFLHEAVRDALLGELPAQARPELHRRIAASIGQCTT